jgi:hypothetical protein
MPPQPTVGASSAPVLADKSVESAESAGGVLVLTAASEHPLYSSWLPSLPFPVDYSGEVGIDFAFPRQTGLVVAADCYREPWATLLRRAVESDIPALILADGILEYRNTWEHPQITPGSIFQPVLAHKIACLGRSQARILESWGNTTHCEIVGSPRFDGYASLHRRERPAPAPFRVLVMTAITPFFTEEQHRLVRQSLLDLRAAFDGGLKVGDASLEPVWRVTKGLDAEIGVESKVTDLTGRQLAEVLQHVDAVITTPSTSMLEAMLLGLPVATLDYCNVPAYVQPSWRISAKEHILPVVAQLVNPPAAKMLFQDTTLHDALECSTPAAPRMQELALRMITCGREARRTGKPLRLPRGLLGPTEPGPAVAEVRFDLRALYPNHVPFREADVQALQAEVGHLRGYAAALERQCRSANQGLPETVQSIIAWKSRLEAAILLARFRQTPAAVQLMVEAATGLQSCRNPAVVLEALVEIGTRLGPLDADRARQMLHLALQLSARTGNTVQRDRANSILSALPHGNSSLANMNSPTGRDQK